MARTMLKHDQLKSTKRDPSELLLDESSDEIDKPGKSKPKKKQVKRRLSGNVCTKWYRAPELTLFEKRYNSQVDMWGLGCIISELSFLTVKDSHV